MRQLAQNMLDTQRDRSSTADRAQSGYECSPIYEGGTHSHSVFPCRKTRGHEDEIAKLRARVAAGDDPNTTVMWDGVCSFSGEVPVNPRGVA